MDARLIRTPALYLVGFMGCGKTTVGTALADELGWSFFDLDDDIEAGSGASIGEIFEREGEPEFRRREHHALTRRVESAKHGQPMVVALGGGAFAETVNADLVRDHGLTVWLDAPFELVRARVMPQTHRPLARDPDRFAALFESRRTAYEKADYRISINGDDPRVAVAEIMGLPIFD